MKIFLDGAIMMSFCVAGLCFLKFWARTHDRLFLMFSFSFFIMAINRLLLTWFVLRGDNPDESQTIIYLIRLAAYVIILIAIVVKNRSLHTTTPPAMYRE